MTNSILLTMGVLTALAGPAEMKSVVIDVIPNDAVNVVDPDAGDPVPVVIFGSRDFDPRTIEIESLRLAGSAPVKSDAGAVQKVEDVNADGIDDLTVWFSPHELRPPASESSVTLRGVTSGGARIEGRDAIRTVKTALRTAPPRSTAEEKAVALRSAAPEPRGLPDRPPGIDSQGRYPGGIVILDQAPASVYPATINVSGLTGVVSKLRVTLD